MRHFNVLKYKENSKKNHYYCPIIHGKGVQEILIVNELCICSSKSSMFDSSAHEWTNLKKCEIHL